MASPETPTSFPEPPAGYRPPIRFEYPKIRLQLAAIVLLLLITPILLLLTSLLQGQSAGGTIIRLDRISDLAIAIVTVLAITAVHELIHGLVYRLLGYRVTYGVSIHLFAAYAAALEQWQKRDHNIAAALAPLIALTAIFVPMLAIQNRLVVLIGLSALLMNTGGAAGDLYLVWCLRRMPSAALLYDVGERTMLVYLPVAAE